MFWAYAKHEQEKEDIIQLIVNVFLFACLIKKYFGKYEGLNRVEVEFSSIEEMNGYEKEKWMGKAVTGFNYVIMLGLRSYLTW